MKKLLILFSFSLFTIHFSLCFAQQQYTFTNYTQEQGLSSGTISGIYKDTTGYLWLMSEEGVSRFDGYNFKVFRHNTDDSTSLPDNLATQAIFSDRGDIYIYTSSGIRIYDPKTLSFRHSPLFGDTIIRLKMGYFEYSDWLNFFSFSSDKESYYAVSDKELLKFGKSKIEFYSFPDKDTHPFLRITTDSVSRAILLVRDSRLAWFFDSKKKKLEKINFPKNSGEPDTSNIYSCVYIKGEDAFIAIGKNGLYRYNRDSNCFVHQFNLPVFKKIKGDIYYCLSVSDKFLYTFSQYGELYQVNVLNGKEKLFYLNKKIPEDELKDRSITIL